MHTPLHHRRRMEETLDQTELINNSWEMVAPAKMSAATNSYNHRDAKHTHRDHSFTSSVLATNTMTQAYGNLVFTTMEASSERRTADTNWLPQSYLGVYQTVKRCICGISERGKASTVTLLKRLWFIRHRRVGKLMWYCERVYSQSSILDECHSDVFNNKKKKNF